MGIIDVIILVIIGVAAGFGIRHMIRTRHTGGCSGNCVSCSHSCGKLS